MTSVSVHRSTPALADDPANGRKWRILFPLAPAGG
jgi:hypothetical protein